MDLEKVGHSFNVSIYYCWEVVNYLFKISYFNEKRDLNFTEITTYICLFYLILHSLGSIKLLHIEELRDLVNCSLILSRQSY